MTRVRRTGIGLAALLTATLAASAATVHDNDVFFAINGLQTFNYAQTGYSITSGQPYQGTTSGVSQAGQQAKITVKAGRKGSTSVASWFKQKVGAGQTLVCDAKGTYPDKLNFAVEGTMTIGVVGGKTVTCDNILIAQGHFGTTNNWWMGGPAMKGAHIGPTGATEQTCKLSGSVLPAVVIFSPQTPCVNNFNISVNLP